jgi:hypothetical protein
LDQTLENIFQYLEIESEDEINVAFQNWINSTKYCVIVFKNRAWITSRSDFEVIHGTSRVVRLVPDKIQTAIAICKEMVDQVPML